MPNDSEITRVSPSLPPAWTPGHEKFVPNADDYGMIAVTPESFYAVVGPLEIHPVLGQQRHDDAIGYVSTWKLRSGQSDTIGKSLGGTTYCDDFYMVTPDFYRANAARLALARANGGGA